MNGSTRAIAFTGAVLALLAVILGALGSHLVDMKGLQDSWDTASKIHLFNAAALLGLAAWHSITGSGLLKWAAWLIIFGTLLFSGSIYLHVITAYKVTSLAPSGGFLMMAGWLLAALSFLRKP